MRGISAIVVGLFLLVPTGLRAADLAVEVRDGDGRPVPDAVVALVPEGGASQPAVAPTAPLIVDQRNEAFIPYVQIVPRGGEVAFRNSDLTRHHVYSFSPVRAFEFVLAPGEQSQPVRLERAGVVAIGCNIHDRMVAYLYVAEGRWAALTDADGRATLGGVPEGAYEAQAWHPRLRPGRPGPTRKLTVAAGANQLAIAVALLAEPNRGADRERARY